MQKSPPAEGAALWFPQWNMLLDLHASARARCARVGDCRFPRKGFEERAGEQSRHYIRGMR